MAHKITYAVSSRNVPKWGNGKQFIAIHYLGVDGQNHDLTSDGCGAHYYIYWDGTIYQRCSHDAIVWQVGTAGYYKQKHPTARNANTIGIEMCCHCDGDKTSAEDKKWYFTTETQEACVWLVQKIMKEENIPIDNVLRHYDIVNKTCPAPYVHNNKYKTSWTWDEFKARVKGQPTTVADPVPTKGKAMGIPTSKEAFIEAVGKIAKDLQAETGILASVVTAQACLETGFGLGSDAVELVTVNNLLGMKKDLINSTWSSYSVWNGKTIVKRTPEYYNGKLVYINDSFRAYEDYEQCLRDYEMFLLHVRNDKGLKYARISGMTDPAEVIHAIRIGTGTDAQPEGYCTDPNYESKVLRLIDQYDLWQYDATTASTPTTTQTAENARTRLVAACRTMNTEMIKSQQTGAKWGYYNSSTSPTFAKALSARNYRANCATTANWALKAVGAMDESLSGFYGEKNGKIKWKSTKTKEAVLAVADVISIGGKKTVSDAMKDGTLEPGDIVAYYDIRHTNTYLGDGKWLDSGHAYANGQGDGAGWQTWIGDTYYGAQKVGCVIRLKVEETAPESEPSVQYRVQVGAYRLKDNAVNQMVRVKAKGFACIVKQYGEYWVAQAGVFSVKANADALVKRLQAAGFNAGVELM